PRLKTDDRRRMTDDWRLRTVVVATAVLVATPLSATLTEAPRLAAIYDAILGAQFDGAADALRPACPPAPEPACRTLSAVSLWWQILINPESRLLDQALNDAAAGAVAAATEWTRREPDSAEAWFYLAAAYGPLVQWR